MKRPTVGSLHHEHGYTVLELMIAILIAFGQGPALIHCSTGDRASSVCAVALILATGLSNSDAVEYATNSLLLANPAMIGLVLGYSPPASMADRIQTAVAALQT